uniref:VWFA domain-containing protein n=1 Tax=Angiostrongylus cantonensis TaxID=6313 RepID=A0A158PCM3_ANGCA
LVLPSEPIFPVACELNVLIVLDRSDSVKGGFNKSRKFVTDVSQEMEIGPRKHRVAMIVYSGLSYRREVFPWNFAKNNEEFVRITNNLRAIGGTTNTKKALEVAIDLMAQRNKTIPTLIMVVTDGRSADDPKGPAQRLQKEPQTWMFAAATGEPESVDKQELLDIAGTPSHVVLHRGREYAADLTRALFRQAQDRVLEVSRNHLLGKESTGKNTKQSTLGEFCFNFKRNAEQPPLLPPRQPQRQPQRQLLRIQSLARCELDLVLVLDFSTTTDPLVEYYKEMSQRLIKALRIGPRYTQVAVVTFATVGRTRTKFNLKKYKTQEEVLKAIGNLRSTGGTTAIGEGIRLGIKQMDEREGARPNIATKVMIVFTDGWFNKGPNPQATAKEAIAAGFELYTVSFLGVVDKAVRTNHEVLSGVAQDPQHRFNEKNFDELIQRVRQRNLKCL